MPKIPLKTETTPVVTRVPVEKPETTKVTYAQAPRHAMDASVDRWVAKQAPKGIVKTPLVSVRHGQYRETLSTLSSEFGLSPRSAAILASHLFAECGDPPSVSVEGQRQAMSAQQLVVWAGTFQKRCGMAWGAMLRSDMRGFVAFLGRSGIEHESQADCEASVNRILKSQEVPLNLYPSHAKDAVAPG